MSETMSAVQKQKQQVELKRKQVYEADRNGNFYQIIYVDDQIVLLRDSEEGQNDEKVHRMERRVHFENSVEAGKFTLKPDSDIDLISASSVDWSEVSHIGEKTRDNLHEEGYETNIDAQQADDEELLEVDGLGPKGLVNLREYIR